MHWLPETGPRCALAATIATLGLIGNLAMITMFTAFGTPIDRGHEDRQKSPRHRRSAYHPQLNPRQA